MVAEDVTLRRRASHVGLELYGLPPNRGNRQAAGLLGRLTRHNPVGPNALRILNRRGPYWQALPYPTLLSRNGAEKGHI